MPPTIRDQALTTSSLLKTTLIILTILTLFPTQSLATSYPRCVSNCISNNPSNSWCNGDETGRAKEECVCRGLDGLSMTRCIAECDPEDQWAFARDLPSTCRERMFPNATESAVNEGEEDGAVRMASGRLKMAVAGSVVFGVVLGRVV
ncbi:hypothetical protein BJX63DRAFT_387593 [Aspergillus granulosus]|uniref:Extracellular membrane protein CFEM domain-containing protein n=1 Tax=Aspergillus granulosus TaxID=176169 RepID=A0ABR4HM26_9EURO